MRLPFEGKCYAIMMENKQENDLFVHGFVRKEMETYNMNIPFALISLIAIWHPMECIHVISEYGKHWKVNVDHILRLKL